VPTLQRAATQPVIADAITAPAAVPPSDFPALQDWLQVRGTEAGPLFCPALKSGRLPREEDQLARLSPGGAWRIDLRRTWIGDLLDLGVDLATVQKMASAPVCCDGA
jgi:hypothetical protein